MAKLQSAKPLLQVADGGEMAAYLARPAGKARGSVLLFQEAFGVTGHIRGLADRLAGEGYLTLAPELFHRSAPAGFEGSYDNFPAVMAHVQKLTVEGLEADIRAAYEHLAAELPGRPIAAVGFCMGGRVAYVAAGAVPLAAAVSYYGGGIDALLDRAPRLRCPLLLFWGGLDRHITAEKRRAVSDALTAAKADFVEVLWARADHAFNNDERPAYNAAAARQAEALRQAFFTEYLR